MLPLIVFEVPPMSITRYCVFAGAKVSFTVSSPFPSTNSRSLRCLQYTAAASGSRAISN